MKTAKLFALFAALTILTTFTAASTLSVSEVDYVETDSDFFDEGHVIIEFQADGTGETIHGEVPASDFSSFVQGADPKPVEVSIQEINSYAEYEIEDRNNIPLQSVEIIHIEEDSDAERQQQIDQQCMDLAQTGSEENYQWETGLYTWKDYHAMCFQQDFNDPRYNIGWIDTPDELFDAQWNIVVEGEPSETATLSNTGSFDGSQERINNVQVEFLRLGDTGASPSETENTLAAYSSQSDWRFINQQHFFEYESVIETEDWESHLQDVAQSDFSLDDSVKTEKENIINQEYDRASQEYGETRLAGDETFQGSSIHDGVVTYEPDSVIEWFKPEFTVRINGEFIGLERSFADPDINRVVSQLDITGVGSDTAEVEVTNVGDGQGVFEPQVTCTDGFSTVGTSSEKIFESGETRSLYATVDSDGDEQLEGNCVFTVEDSETGSTVQTTLDAEYEPDATCEAGQVNTFIDSDGNEQIVQCTDDGQSFEEIETCESGEETAERVNGQWECVDLEDNDTIDTGSDSIFDGITNPFQEAWSGLQNAVFGGLSTVDRIIQLIDFMVVTLAFLFGFGFGSNTLYQISGADRIESIPKQPVKIALGLIFAVALTYIIYQLVVGIWSKIFLLMLIGIILYLYSLVSGYLAVLFSAFKMTRTNR